MSHNDYRTKGEHCQPKTLNIALKGRKGDETQGPLKDTLAISKPAKY